MFPPLFLFKEYIKIYHKHFFLQVLNRKNILTLAFLGPEVLLVRRKSFRRCFCPEEMNKVEGLQVCPLVPRFINTFKDSGDFDKEHSRGLSGGRGRPPDGVTAEKRDEKERFAAPEGLGPYGSGSFRLPGQQTGQCQTV